MKRIPIDQAAPGMILAQKIVREDGVLLCQQGAELTEPMLRMLRRLNLETLPITVQSTENPEERAARLEREGQEIEARFSRVSSDPILSELKKAIGKKLHEAD